MKKYLFSFIFICFLILVVTTACCNRYVLELPDVEIVYQSKDRDQQTIGFIDVNGIQNTISDLDFYANRPIWSLDGKEIMVLKSWGNIDYGKVDIAATRGGQIIRFYQEDRISICKNRELRGVGQMEPAGNLDDHQILIENAGLELILFDYVKCEEIIKYVDLESYDEGQIVGASLSSDGRSLVYALSSSLEEEDIEYIINIMDTQSMEVRAIGSGVYPSWSPDDQWIAYVGWDGIRMMESDGMHDRLIVEYDSTIDYPLRGMGFMTTSPIPQWSPDGEWLVYHKCTSVTKDCEYIKVFSIFRFELSTGREFLILEGGAYPDWKGD